MSNKESSFMKMFTKEHRNKNYMYYVFTIMLLGGIAALIAAFVLTLDKFEVLQNPNAVLSCSVNVVLNCSTVMQTWQSHDFGFPNMILGLMAFPVMIMIAANIGFFLAVLFAYWLFFQSVYAIQVLCPWCLVVTTSMTVVFSTMLHYNLKENTFKFAKKYNDRIQRFLEAGYHQMIVLSWIALMVVLVFLKFGQALFA
jgi:uncharacterized membrane protein